MSAAREPVDMARATKPQPNPLKRWWITKRDSHFQIYTSLTLISFAIMLFSFLFLFFMDGVMKMEVNGNESLIPLVWFGLVGGAVALLIFGPEFYYFYGKREILKEILELDSRAEVMRRRKDAEIAADLLGPTYQSLLKGLYEDLGIGVPKRYLSIPTKSSEQEAGPGSVSEEEE